VVKCNLSIRLVDQAPFIEFVQFLNLYITILFILLALFTNNYYRAIKTFSSKTLERDIKDEYLRSQALLCERLQTHTANRGRISLTTDCWSARNYKEFSGVTAHWIDKEFNICAEVLDVLYLKEPIHSGDYLARALLGITDEYGISDAIHTITRDNASANDLLLRTYESLVATRQTEQQPWPFTVRNGDVRCITHVLNLSVQALLTSIRAEPSKEATEYQVEEGKATVISQEAGLSALAKLRRLVYIFRNRHGFLALLKTQCLANNVKFKRP